MRVLSFSFFYSIQEGFSKIVKLLCELSVLCLILKLDETVFPNGSGLIQHDNVPCHTTTIVQKWFEEHNSSMCWLGLQTHISIQMSMCRMYWRNKSDQWRAHLTTYRTEDLLLTSWCQIPRHTFRGLVESMSDGSKLYWWPTQYSAGGYNVMADRYISWNMLRDGNTKDNQVQQWSINVR